jgi:Cft2 family RNA processing exonuclease
MPEPHVYFTSLGSVGEVGASAHLIEINGLSLLLDCGLHPKKEGKDSLPDFSVLRRAPDAVLISHAHHDHCAALPYLLKMFPAAVPFATAATVAVLDRMLHNSVSVMEKMRAERGIEDYPLYTHDDVDYTVRRLYRGVPMDSEFAILPDNDVRVCFSHAGHVLGSACTRISSPDHSIFYTSDICVIDQELMSGMAFPKATKQVDTLIVESTYGANPTAHEVEYRDEVKRFAKGVTRVLNRDGVVLVPSFALGRTQEVLNMISRLQGSGRIPQVPVYASGLGRAIYDVYARFAGDLKRDARLTPIDEFEAVGDVWDPRVVNGLAREPSIIVATSGMMLENTPSALIAEKLITDPKHAIFFVGYCDPETLGYNVRTSKPGDEFVFRLGGRPVTSRCEEIEWFHFSAHAHRQDLLGVIDSIPSRNLIFVHGDEPAVEWMYHHGGEGRRRFMPRIGERIALE